MIGKWNSSVGKWNSSVRIMLRKLTSRLIVDLGQSRNVFLLRLVQMRSEGHTPSVVVGTWRSNVGAKAAEVFSMCFARNCAPWRDVLSSGEFHCAYGAVRRAALSVRQ